MVGLLQDETDPMVSVMKVQTNLDVQLVNAHRVPSGAMYANMKDAEFDI